MRSTQALSRTIAPESRSVHQPQADAAFYIDPPMKKSCFLVFGLVATLLVQGQAQAPGDTSTGPPANAPGTAGISAPWDISQTVAALVSESARVKPLLDQVTPREWVSKGAPDAYVAQWQSAQTELTELARVAQGLEKQPERLTLALDTYFRMQSLETRVNSLVEGVRRYQNPAVGDLLVSVLGESASNREKLREYITDLAMQKEQEFTIVDKEAQRCRTNLNRQAAPRPAPAKAPANPPAAPKPAATKQP